MGLRKAVALCLTFAVVANAQSIFNDLAAKENQLNCLLGKPNCIPPSPPPPSGVGTSPPPPGGSSPPGSTPGSSPPGSTPGSSPPGSTPGSGPGKAPGSGPSSGPGSSPGSGPASGPGSSAPAPGPAANGNAVAVVSLSFPDGYVVTDQVRQQLTDIIQQALGNQAQVQLQIGTGRKLLSEQSTLTLLISNAVDCNEIAQILERLFGSGDFVQQAQKLGIPLQAASLSGFACTKPGQAPVVITGSPAVAPSGPTTPSSGPSSGGTTPSGGSTPSGSPSGSTTPSGGSTPSGSPSGSSTPNAGPPAGGPGTPGPGPSS